MSARNGVERARTAYHEAGHLVIGSLFGFRCASVSIRPDESRGSLGRVVPLDRSEGSREVIEQRLCTLFAGWAAERRFSPGEEREAREAAWGDDAQAEGYLERLGMRTHTARHLLRARTAALIEQHWPAIEYVARALLRHEELDGDEAERLCAIARGSARAESETPVDFRKPTGASDRW